MSIITTETSAPKIPSRKYKRNTSFNTYHKIDDGYRIETLRGHEIFIAAEDLELVSSYTWRVHFGNLRNVVPRLIKCAITDIPGTTRIKIKMHRLILNLQNPDIMVDHKDGNPLNNRRANLRIATASENSRNAKKQRYRKGKATTSIYKGVNRCHNSIENIWRATIYVNGKKMHLGCFATEVEAAQAYNTAALKYFGAFALLNVIPAVTQL